MPDDDDDDYPESLECLLHDVLWELRRWADTQGRKEREVADRLEAYLAQSPKDTEGAGAGAA